MSTHTPGPWQIAEASSAPFINITDSGHADICAVTDVYGEQQANASLIASAPDLLRVVKLLKLGIESGHIKSRTMMVVTGTKVTAVSLIDEAAAAIAKAEVTP